MNALSKNTAVSKNALIKRVFMCACRKESVKTKAVMQALYSKKGIDHEY